MFGNNYYRASRDTSEHLPLKQRNHGDNEEKQSKLKNLDMLSLGEKNTHRRQLNMEKIN